MFCTDDQVIKGGELLTRRMRLQAQLARLDRAIEVWRKGMEPHSIPTRRKPSPPLSDARKSTAPRRLNGSLVDPPR